MSKKAFSSCSPSAKVHRAAVGGIRGLHAPRLSMALLSGCASRRLPARAGHRRLGIGPDRALVRRGRRRLKIVPNVVARKLDGLADHSRPARRATRARCRFGGHLRGALGHFELNLRRKEAISCALLTHFCLTNYYSFCHLKSGFERAFDAR